MPLLLAGTSGAPPGTTCAQGEWLGVDGEASAAAAAPLHRGGKGRIQQAAWQAWQRWAWALALKLVFHFLACAMPV